MSRAKKIIALCGKRQQPNKIQDFDESPCPGSPLNPKDFQEWEDVLEDVASKAFAGVTAPRSKAAVSTGPGGGLEKCVKGTRVKAPRPKSAVPTTGPRGVLKESVKDVSLAPKKDANDVSNLINKLITPQDQCASRKAKSSSDENREAGVKRQLFHDNVDGRSAKQQETQNGLLDGIAILGEADDCTDPAGGKSEVVYSSIQDPFSQGKSHIQTITVSASGKINNNQHQLFTGSIAGGGSAEQSVTQDGLLDGADAQAGSGDSSKLEGEKSEVVSSFIEDTLSQGKSDVQTNIVSASGKRNNDNQGVKHQLLTRNIVASGSAEQSVVEDGLLDGTYAQAEAGDCSQSAGEKLDVVSSISSVLPPEKSDAQIYIISAEGTLEPLIVPEEDSDLLHTNSEEVQVLAVSPVDDSATVSTAGDSTPNSSAEQSGIAVAPGAVDVSQASRKRKRSAAQSDPDASPKRRHCNPAMWRYNIAKAACTSGLEHINKNGKVIPAKTLRVGCGADCHQKCHENFPHLQREEIFNKFWKIDSHSRKWDFIARHVQAIPVKRRTTCIIEDGEDLLRKSNYIYHLSKDGALTRVCCKFFLDTLGVSSMWVRTALKKLNKGEGTISPDKRGTQKGSRKKISNIVRESVIDHIRKFPHVEGHYTRKKSKRKYLDEKLSRRKMYSMYIIDAQSKGLNKIASRRQYCDIFNKDFYLSFFKPKKDQCGTCLAWKHASAAEKAKKNAAENFKKHIDNKNAARKQMQTDIEFAAKNKEVCVCTIDLQKVFLCPHGENGEFFYRSKLSCYNFTVFQSSGPKDGQGQGHCYVWDQTLGHRGSTEITTLMLLFLEEKIAEGYKDFRIHSDNCYGQNKNKALFSMYHYVCQKYGVTITHHYLEKGHTQMPCDSMHAAIERCIKNIEVFVPSHWYAYIRMPKKTPPFYKVKEMNFTDFLDFAPMSKLLNWTSIPVAPLREITFSSDKPYVVSLKTSLQQEQSIEFSLSFARRGRPINWKEFKLSSCYNSKFPLKKRERKDLLHLCSKGHIPSVHHEYYAALASLGDDNINLEEEDCEGDGASGTSSSENDSEYDASEAEDNNDQE